MLFCGLGGSAAVLPAPALVFYLLNQRRDVCFAFHILDKPKFKLSHNISSFNMLLIFTLHMAR